MKAVLKSIAIFLCLGTLLVLISSCTDLDEGSIRPGVPVFGTYGLANIARDRFDLVWPVLPDETGQRIITSTAIYIQKPPAASSAGDGLAVSVADLVANLASYLSTGYSMTILQSGSGYEEINDGYPSDVLGTYRVTESQTNAVPGAIEYRSITNLQPDTWYYLEVDTRLKYEHWGLQAEPIQFLVKTLP